MALTSGTRLGSYEIVSPLGAGGMGEVYWARDTRLGRDVAIKVLPQAFALDAGRLARFEREARILASNNHPNIAAIHELGNHEGTPFLVMEFIPGETLSDRIRAGGLSVADALSLARQMAEALGAAHAKGVVHRDLKPANIMVTPEGKVKILDFGLAKQSQPSADATLGTRATATAAETMPGTILGTAGYMSPEQARGKSGDERSDIWAFGCILSEMLSGRRTFDGDTASDRIAAILAREPDWSAIPKHVPESIRQLLRRCLEKDLERRLQEIGEARSVIDRALESLRAGRVFPIRLPFGRTTVVAVLVAFLVLATAVIWVARTRYPSAATAIPDRKILAVLPFKDLNSQDSGQLIGDGLVATLSARLAQLAGIQVVMPSAVIPASDKDADAFRLARSFGANLVMQGTFRRSGERIRIAFSVWNAHERIQIAGDTLDGAASDMFGIEDRLAEAVISSLKVSGPPPPHPQATGLDRASEQEQYIKAIGSLQRYDKEAAIDEAIRVLTSLAQQKPAAPLVHAALGRAYLNKFRLTRDKSWIALASQACNRAQQLSPDFPEVDVTAGELRTASGQAKEAIPAFRRALSMQPNHFGALLGLADALNVAGDLREAEATYKRAIDLQPSYWGGYSKLAGFFFLHARYAQAADAFRRVTELSPDNARAFGNLGAAHQLMGNFEEALTAYRKSLALSPTAMVYSNIGTLEFYSGRSKAAVDAYESAVKLTPGHFELWANLGDAYRWTPGLEAKAADAYGKAISLCRDELRVNAENGLVHSVLALSLAKTGKAAEAAEQAQKALSLDPESPEFLFNAAVVANIGNRRKEALAWILLAARKGYPRAFIAREPEFKNLRSDTVFKEAVRQ